MLNTILDSHLSPVYQTDYSIRWRKHYPAYSPFCYNTGMKIWSFDLGIGSLAYAVRGHGDNEFSFQDVASLTVEEDYGSTKDESSRRRMHRTRIAHQAREAWLRQVFEEAGLGDAILVGRNVGKMDGRWQLTRPGDYRLEREFPPRPGQPTRDGAPSDKQGTATAYCGALLRCLLLAGPEAQSRVQGRPLEPWQVFKALHSAIQKRGYDGNLPWKRSATAEDDDSKTTAQRANTMQSILDELPEGCRHPCYWEAQSLGLWDPGDHERFALRIDHQARTAKRAERPDPGDAKSSTTPAVFLRQTVEAELIDLYAAAAGLLPQLVRSAHYFLYGPAETDYASYRMAHASPADRRRMEEKAGGRLVPGKEDDWQGVLSQKIPTFDNRVPSRCLLIPRLNAAKRTPRIHDGQLVPASMLPAEYIFLKQLKDFRYLLGTDQHALTAEQIREVFADRRAAADQAVTKSLQESDGDHDAVIAALNKLRLTKTDLKKWIKKFSGRAAVLSAGQEAVDSPKGSGRSAYSRPALRILKVVLLSGVSPPEAHRALLAADGDPWRRLAADIKLSDDMSRGLVPEDLAFLDRMGDTWEKFYVPDARLDHAARLATEGSREQRDHAVRSLVGQQNDPVIRHRLGAFHRTLKALEARHGPPDRVVLEFVRDDFMRGDSDEAKKRRKKYLDHQSKRRKQREEARGEIGANASDSDILRFQLWKEQQSECLFCGGGIGSPGTTTNGKRGFADTHIAHVVPDSRGGPRAYLNLVLACSDCNDAQRNRYHADWFVQEGRDWHAFLQRVEGFSTMSRFKKKLLSCADADEAARMVENRTALQQTAWIAKLSQAVVCLHMGWPLNFEGGERRIVVVPGAITNAVATKYGLYRMLGNPDERREQHKAMQQALDDAEAADCEHLARDERKQRWQAYYKCRDTLYEKHRGDHRHHALDAMILSFIPNWAADHSKRFWFGLPKEADYPFFERHLSTVVPRMMAFTKPGLEESIYGARESVACKRHSLLSLAYTGQNPKFNAKTGARESKKIVDDHIRKDVLSFLEGRPTEEDWIAFCNEYHVRSRSNSPGPLVRRVKLRVDELKEYENLSKDGSGAWRKGNRHQGYYVVRAEKGRIKVIPVYAHASPAAVKERIERDPSLQVQGYYTSGCRIRLGHSFQQGKKSIPAGEYILRSLWTAGPAKIDAPNGVAYVGIGIGNMVEAGLERLE